MTTVKVKLRPSSRKGGMGTIVLQVIHNRIVRQMATEFHLYPEEWESHTSSILLDLVPADRKAELLRIQRKLSTYVMRLHAIVSRYEQQGAPYASDEVLASFRSWKETTITDGFIDYCEKLISRLLSIGRQSSAAKLRTSLNSFMRFLADDDVSLQSLDTCLIEQYAAYLRNTGLCINTSAFYMRNLRCAYNKAVDEGITPQQYPFRKVYTGSVKTIKRGLTFSQMRDIKRMPLVGRPMHDFARTVFLLSFYMRGIPPIDLAFLRHSNLRNGIITYRRHKTLQKLTLKWEPCMQKLADHLWHLVGGRRSDSPFLLPIIHLSSTLEAEDGNHLNRLYFNAARMINSKLHDIGEEISLSHILTSYVARHSWASIAKNRNIPLSAISEGLGHDNEKTTRIYLASLDADTLDDFNRKVWKGL